MITRFEMYFDKAIVFELVSRKSGNVKELYLRGGVTGVDAKLIFDETAFENIKTVINGGLQPLMGGSKRIVI